MKLSLRVCIAVFAFANVALLFYGSSLLVNPDLLFVTPNTSAYLLGLARLLGFFNLAISIVGSLLIIEYLRSKTPALLRAFLISTALAYAGPMVFDNTLGSIGPAEIAEHAIFAAMILTAIIALFATRAGRDFA